jgi:hypothetical protein
MVDREVADSMRRKAIRSKKHQGDNSTKKRKRKRI